MTKLDTLAELSPSADFLPFEFGCAGGSVVNLLNPQPDDISFSDIVDALARIPRFNGHQVLSDDRFWSIAHHLVMGARLASPEARPYWLLHDGHEGVIGDLTSPLISAIQALSDRDVVEIIKHQFDEVIYHKADLEWPMPPHIAKQVKNIDRMMLSLEERALRLPSVWCVSKGLPELNANELSPWDDAAGRLWALFAEYGWLPKNRTTPDEVQKKLWPDRFVKEKPHAGA